MKDNSLVLFILQQKQGRTLLVTLGSLIVAFILGRQMAAGSYFFLMMLVSLAGMMMIFFRRNSVIVLLPAILVLPNVGLDIPGPWAVTVEDAFIMAVFLGYLLRCIITRERIFPRNSPHVVPYVAFLVIATLSLFKSVQVGAGTYLTNLKDLMRMTELFLLYVVLYDVLDSYVKIERLVRNILLLTAIFAVVSFYVYVTKNELFYALFTMQPAYIYLYPFIILRMISIAGSTSQTGMWFAIALSMAIYFEPFRRTKFRRIGWVLLVTSISLCILFTFNRGTWVGILFGLFVLLLHGKVNWKKLLLSGLVALAIIALLVVIFFGDADLERQALKAFKISKHAGEARWVRWVSAVNAILEHPLLGVGYNNYAWVYGLYSIDKNQTQQYGSPHNMFVDILTGTGLLGFSAFFVLLFRIYRTLRKTMRSKIKKVQNLGTAFYLAFFSFLGASMFDSFFYKPHHTGILIVTVWVMGDALARVDSGQLPLEPPGKEPVTG